MIRGGDWSDDRIVPDAMRALHAGQPLIVRNPDAVRPWQYVLNPLGGYMTLAERLYHDGPKWSGAWNFGPREADAVSVREIVEELMRRWGCGSWRHESSANSPHED